MRWTDAEDVTSGRDALEAKCVALQEQLGELQIAAAGPVHQLPNFGYLSWDLVDPTTGQAGMSGFDAAVIEGGAISAPLYGAHSAAVTRSHA